jgi:hypothetical protein
MQKAPIFDKIYAQYISDVSAIDLDRVQDRLEIGRDGDSAIIPFYGTPYRVSGQGVVDPSGQRSSHAVSVILCKYLLMCPESAPTGGSDWVKYNDFKDAAPFAGGFRNMAERPISAAFSGRLEDLEKACAALGGQPGSESISCDLNIRFQALPKLPLLLLFNDEDEDFPAQCSLLFEKRASAYLDMECLAMLGMVLAVWLKEGPGRGDF